MLPVQLIFLIIAAGAVIFGLGSGLFLEDDNEIEEVSEEVLKMETGRNVDFTPKSPENAYEYSVHNF